MNESEPTGRDSERGKVIATKGIWSTQASAKGQLLIENLGKSESECFCGGIYICICLSKGNMREMSMTNAWISPRSNIF